MERSGEVARALISIVVTWRSSPLNGTSTAVFLHILELPVDGVSLSGSRGFGVGGSSLGRTSDLGFLVGMLVSAFSKTMIRLARMWFKMS